MANETRTHILDAAERLLGRYGYRKMTVDDLAAEAGIGKGTVYLSFPSKEEVVLGTVDRIVDAVCDEMERLAASDKPVTDRVRAMLTARILIRFDRVADYRQSLNDLLSFVRKGLLERRERHFAREIDILAKLVPRRTARALVLATNNFLPYALSPAELGDRRRLQRDATGVIDLLVIALSNGTPASTPAGPQRPRLRPRRRDAAGPAAVTAALQTLKENPDEEDAVAAVVRRPRLRPVRPAEGLHHHRRRARSGHQGGHRQAQ
jgi:AcrR family transcriptional regulator